MLLAVVALASCEKKVPPIPANITFTEGAILSPTLTS